MGTVPDLDRLACLAGRSWRVSELPGGLTNTNLRVTTDDGDPRVDVVVRWSRVDTSLLGIDRDEENANTRAAAEAGVGAPVVDYRPDLRMLVIGYLPGRSLESSDLADADLLARTAQAVRRLHAGPRFTGGLDMFARQASYLSTVRTHAFDLPAGYDDHADAWADVRRALAASPRPAVPCHRDLLAANVIHDPAATGQEVRLIDYEYSGQDDACFELGNTATECDFTDEQTEAWVEAYFGRPSAADLARVRLQMLVSEYGWSLWGYIQAATSPLDFDFTGWGRERYEKAARRFADRGLPALLETVARG